MTAQFQQQHRGKGSLEYTLRLEGGISSFNNNLEARWGILPASEERQPQPAGSTILLPPGTEATTAAQHSLPSAIAPPHRGYTGSPPWPRHFVSPRAGGAAAGLGLAAPLRAEPPTEGRHRPADAAPQSPTQPGGTAVQPQGTHKKHRQRQRLRHGRHLPHHLPALSFIPRAARRLAAPPVSQAGNFPGAEPAPVLVAERRDPDRDPDPKPDPDPDPDPDPGSGPAAVRTAGELGALRSPAALADRSPARGTGVLPSTGVAPPQRRGPGRRELPGSGLRVACIWPVPGLSGRSGGRGETPEGAGAAPSPGDLPRGRPVSRAVAVIVPCLSFPSPGQGGGCRRPPRGTGWVSVFPAVPRGRGGGSAGCGWGSPSPPGGADAPGRPRSAVVPGPAPPSPRLAQPRPFPGPTHLPPDYPWFAIPPGRAGARVSSGGAAAAMASRTLLSMLFSFLFDFFLLVQPCVSVSDADPEAGIAGAEMAASFSFGREAQLVSPFLLPQFHAKTPTEGREKKK